jgi:hypothetical protein
MSSAIFLKKIGSGMHSEPKFGLRGGGVLVILMLGKQFQNSSGLRPSEKELP